MDEEAILPYQTSQSMPFNPEGILELSDTRKLINNFILDLIGLKEEKDGKGKKLVRYKKPEFTYDFAIELQSRIFQQINTTTARTDMDYEQIRRYNVIYMEKLAKVFATRGMKHLVSDNAWLQIIKEDWGNVDLFKKTESEWTYHEPVTADMLQHIKKKHGLETESFHQDVILMDHLISVQYFIDSGRRRAENALTLGHEKVVRKETMISNSEQKGGAQSGLFSRFRDGLQG